MRNAGLRFALLGIVLGALAVTAGIASQSRGGGWDSHAVAAARAAL